MAEPEDDSAPVSRVYVSGLPPSMTRDQLRAHFSTKYVVTDAHVVSDRRIGFVGFSTHHDAKSAAQYFNKSFVRMSKILVTLAKPVEVKRDVLGQAAPVSQRLARQRRPGKGDAAVEPSRKRKRGPEEPDNRATATSPTRSGVNLSEPSSARESEDATGEGDAALVENGPASDADWLRGKTNRTLDLMADKEADAGTTTADERPGDHYVSMATAEAAEPDKVHPIPSNSATAETTRTVAISNARLFIRNLPFDTTESDIKAVFAPFGRISEIHLVTDTRRLSGKGIGYVQFVEPADAEHALVDLDGKDFHGRLMHILPASDKKVQKLTEFDISKLPLKQQRALKRKREAPTASFSWNSLYMNPDAVLASVADRLGVSKSDVLDPSSTDAAVKQAHAETSIIKETKDYLREHGINVDALQKKPRDDRTILLKNLSYGTTSDELFQMLTQYGPIERLVFPPTGTVAVARYQEPYAANLAVKQLAYRNFKGSLLYIEKAPAGVWDLDGTVPPSKEAWYVDKTPQDITEPSIGPTVTVFVRNLNFSTTTARLSEAFSPLSGFVSARVKTRTDASRPGEILSMGFGFVEFRSQAHADAAIATMNTRTLDGHQLLVQASQKTVDLAEERRRETSDKKQNAKKTKIIIKNLPFEATKKDVRALFGAYGQLRTVRMPKKFDNSTRGFAFAEFLTAKEAESAMEALSNTHLLGRRLVLDFAEAEAVDPEAEIQAMERKVQGHQSSLTHYKMTGSARKKFNVNSREDVEPL